MLRYVLRRFAHAILVLWATFTATFFLLFILPGDRALAKLGVDAGGAGFSPEALAELRRQMGLDQPAIVQYWIALKNAVKGDFGVSAQTGADALQMFATGIPETLKLAVVALSLGTVAGIAWALVASYTRWTPLRNVLSAAPALGVSIPSFWIGLVLLQVLSFQLNLLPGIGNDGWRTLVMPAIVLAIPSASIAAQILLRSLQSSLSAAYVDTARSRGAGRGRILLGHALRNSIIPVITALGTSAGYMIAGSVVVETVFSRSGIGLITVKAVTYQDTPLVLVAVVFAATVYVTVNFIVDLFYPLIDRRIDLGISRRWAAKGESR
ncbi:ABC transporter permease [Mesorhizobium sp. DCY119]|uniref:ABC transporter permease n=1 Tax=Mesorhizobium sp. DCY119 TaxID=2108445 RepID=UPI000E75F2C1|nr:ABC transporter permease [Mesorhizobium sp. DCY119]RJG40454.1 ABC transporter permease [Mesorhizobium sp. DCY119]